MDKQIMYCLCYELSNWIGNLAPAKTKDICLDHQSLRDSNLPFPLQRTQSTHTTFTSLLFHILDLFITSSCEGASTSCH